MDIASHRMGLSQRRDTQRPTSSSQRHQPVKQPDRELGVINSRRTPSRTHREKPQQSNMASQEAQTHAGTSNAKSKSMAWFKRGQGVASPKLREDERNTAQCTKNSKNLQSELSTMHQTLYGFYRASKMVLTKMHTSSIGRQETRLISRTAQGKEPVYNLEVDNTHCFAIQGGIIVHNSFDSGTYGIVAYVKTNPGMIIKASNQTAKPKQWTVNNGVIKPEEDIMDKIRTNIQKTDRTWQS
jgi:hypothetical protein